MRHKYWTTVAVMTCMLGAPAPALSCGESLFRVGKGVTYRHYNAPIPGVVVVVAKTPGELAMAEMIESAGHHVLVVSDASKVNAALDDHSADVVLAWYRDRDIVASVADRHSVAYLPVTADGEEREARASYDLTVSGDDKVKHFLKAIHKTLKQRNA